MLEHEPQETPAAQIPAAQRRVSAEELTRAVTALEDAKAAERVAGVAPIGQVVDELGLDSTPEEIWAQVEKQRAQKAAEEQAKQMPVIAHPAAIFQTPPRPRRPILWLVVLAVALVCGGGTLINSSTSTSPSIVTSSGQAITISGDATTETVPVQGKDVIISGNADNLTLQGKARSVTVSGNANTVSGEEPQSVQVDGDANNVEWTAAPPAVSDTPHTKHMHPPNTL